MIGYNKKKNKHVQGSPPCERLSGHIFQQVKKLHRTWEFHHLGYKISERNLCAQGTRLIQNDCDLWAFRQHCIGNVHICKDTSESPCYEPRFIATLTKAALYKHDAKCFHFLMCFFFSVFYTALRLNMLPARPRLFQEKPHGVLVLNCPARSPDSFLSKTLQNTAVHTNRYLLRTSWFFISSECTKANQFFLNLEDPMALSALCLSGKNQQRQQKKNKSAFIRSTLKALPVFFY